MTTRCTSVTTNKLQFCQLLLATYYGQSKKSCNYIASQRRQVYLNVANVKFININTSGCLQTVDMPNVPDTSQSPPLFENSIAFTHPKWPSRSFLNRLVQPPSLRRWNSSFIRWCPVMFLRDRNPTDDLMPQPITSFILAPRFCLETMVCLLATPLLSYRNLYDSWHPMRLRKCKIHSCPLTFSPGVYLITCWLDKNSETWKGLGCVSLESCSHSLPAPMRSSSSACDIIKPADPRPCTFDVTT